MRLSQVRGSLQTKIRNLDEYKLWVWRFVLTLTGRWYCPLREIS